jgi:hypothetical protein
MNIRKNVSPATVSRILNRTGCRGTLLRPNQSCATSMHGRGAPIHLDIQRLGHLERVCHRVPSGGICYSETFPRMD